MGNLRRERRGRRSRRRRRNEENGEEDLDYLPSYDELMLSEGERVSERSRGNEVTTPTTTTLTSVSTIGDSLNYDLNQDGGPTHHENGTQEIREGINGEESLNESGRRTRRRGGDGTNEILDQEEEDVLEIDNLDVTQNQPLLNQKKKKKSSRRNTEDSLNSMSSTSTSASTSTSTSQNQASSSNQENEFNSDGFPQSPLTKTKKKSKNQDKSKLNCLVKKE